MTLARKALLGGTMAAALLMAGCGIYVDHQHGYVPDAELIAQIEPGKQDREQVRQLLGSPSSQSTLDDRTWYYVSKHTERIAFMPTRTVDQRVLIIGFDEEGKVSEVRHLGIEDGRPIDLVTRETPTKGQEFSLLEQLVGNIGRFNNKKQ